MEYKNISKLILSLSLATSLIFGSTVSNAQSQSNEASPIYVDLVSPPPPSQYYTEWTENLHKTVQSYALEMSDFYNHLIRDAIHRGADPNGRDKKGRTPLMVAIAGDINPQTLDRGGLVKKSLGWLVLIGITSTVYKSWDLLWEKAASLSDDPEFVYGVKGAADESADWIKESLTKIFNVTAKVGIGAMQDTLDYTEDALQNKTLECGARMESVRTIVAMGGDPNETFTDEESGETVTILELAQKQGCTEVVTFLIEQLEVER